MNKTLLIVDDDSFLLDMYAMRFTQAGFTVEVAMSADTAIEKLRGGLLPDVMITDVVMPITDGFELLRMIVAENLTPKTVKICLSNLSQEEDIKKAKNLGAVEYIVKANNTPSEVVDRVLTVMKQYGL